MKRLKHHSKYLNYLPLILISIYTYKKYPKIKNLIILKDYLKGKSLINYLNLFGISGLNKESIICFNENIKALYKHIKNNDDLITINTALVNDYYDELISIAYQDFKIVFDHTSEFLELLNLLNNNLDTSLTETIFTIEKDRLSKASTEEKIELINDFYKLLNRDFIINKELLDQTFCIYEKHSNDEEELFKTSLNGYNIRKNNKNYVLINNTGYLMDSIAWVHETRHYINQPNDDRNALSHILTESISYVEELIFMDYLKDLGYEYEANMNKLEDLINFKSYIDDASIFYKMLHVYISNNGNLSKENYLKLYPDNYEDDLLKTLGLLQSDTQNIFNMVSYSLAAFLSLYMYIEYKNDNSFIFNIEKLNSIINNASFYDCLKEIKLTNNGKNNYLSWLDDESTNKILTDINTFEEELKQMIKNKEIFLFNNKTL